MVNHDNPDVTRELRGAELTVRFVPSRADNCATRGRLMLAHLLGYVGLGEWA